MKCQPQRKMFSEAIPEDTTIKLSVNQVETGQKSIHKFCNCKFIDN